MRNWIERIRDYSRGVLTSEHGSIGSQWCGITAAQRDIYEHAYLQQQQIINRLKAEKERCKCCSLD